MKAKAYTVRGSVRAAARAATQMMAAAYAMREVAAEGMAVTEAVTPAGYALPTVAVSGRAVGESGLHHFMYVEPEATQEMVWMNPDGIDYTITTSTRLDWEII